MTRHFGCRTRHIMLPGHMFSSSENHLMPNSTDRQTALRRFITCQHPAFSLSTSDKFLLLKTLMNYCLSTIFLSVSTEYNFLLFVRRHFQIVLSLTYRFKPTVLSLLQRVFRRCSVSEGKAVSVTRYGHHSIDRTAEYKVSYYKKNPFRRARNSLEIFYHSVN